MVPCIWILKIKSCVPVPLKIKLNLNMIVKIFHNGYSGTERRTGYDIIAFTIKLVQEFSN